LIDVSLVEECYESFKRALELLEEIEKKIEEFCSENNIILAFRESRFEPFYIAKKTEYLMVYRAYQKSKIGYVVVTKDGKIEWKEKITWRRDR